VGSLPTALATEHQITGHPVSGPTIPEAGPSAKISRREHTLAVLFFAGKLGHSAGNDTNQKILWGRNNHETHNHKMHLAAKAPLVSHQ
jgi:hypothetical protein